MQEEQSRHNEEAVRAGAADCILDNLNIAVLVSDMSTNKILYANKKMRQMYEGVPLIGRICWEALKGETKRCKDCPVSRLLKYPMESYQQVTCEEDRCLQITDSIIPWPGGKLAHLRYMAEISKDERG